MRTENAYNVAPVMFLKDLTSNCFAGESAIGNPMINIRCVMRDLSVDAAQFLPKPRGNIL